MHNIHNVDLVPKKLCTYRLSFIRMFVDQRKHTECITHTIRMDSKKFVLTTREISRIIHENDRLYKSLAYGLTPAHRIDTYTQRYNSLESISLYRFECSAVASERRIKIQHNNTMIYDEVFFMYSINLFVYILFRWGVINLLP